MSTNFSSLVSSSGSTSSASSPLDLTSSVSSASCSAPTSLSSTIEEKETESSEDMLSWIFPSQFIDYFGVGALSLEDFNGDTQSFEAAKQTVQRRNRLHRTKSLLYLHHLCKALK